jgi:cytochrome c oxidase subunit 2
MKLVVVAEPPEAFATWLAHQAEPAGPPSSPEAAEGQRIFETHACGLCHMVRGTQALGTVGPDLTHLASRMKIAGNTIPNSHAYLEAWAVRAQSFKPGAQMPDLTGFTGRELELLATWLQGLK